MVSFNKNNSMLLPIFLSDFFFYLMVCLDDNPILAIKNCISFCGCTVYGKYEFQIFDHSFVDEF